VLARDAHATLFAWILAEALHAESGPGSRGGVEGLHSKGVDMKAGPPIFVMGHPPEPPQWGDGV
jgi:hypothetical protein